MIGMIFDLDGTLADSRLDFVRIRAALGIAPGAPVLEALESLPDLELRAMKAAQLEQMELDAGLQAVWMPGAERFFSLVGQRGLKTAIFTRNSRKVSLATLEKLGASVDLLVTRDDAPAKPRPEGLWNIIQSWRCERDDVLFIGDYRYDLDSAAAAGIKSVLFHPHPGELPSYALSASYVVREFVELEKFLPRS